MSELRDQAAHFGSNLGLTLLTCFPIVGSLVVLVWAISREYYQKKLPTLTFFENFWMINFWNLDLRWSYAGIVTGNVLVTIFWAWTLGWF